MTSRLETRVTERPVLTAPFEPPTGSAFDPMVEEVTWLGWEVRATDPAGVDEGVLRAITSGFDRLVETGWSPGRTIFVTEVSGGGPTMGDVAGGGGPRLAVRLLVGSFGEASTTESEALGLALVAESVLCAPHSPYTVAALDPSTVIDPKSRPKLAGDGVLPLEHLALIRQRTVEIPVGDDEEPLSVVSRFNPLTDPWSGVARLVASLDGRVRVRATVMATELSAFDQTALGRQIQRAARLVADPATPNDVVHHADRGRLTLLDLQASFASPLFITEIAIASEDVLAASTLRAVGASFTSEMDVIRRQGYAVVAAQQTLLGGFEVEREPDRLGIAQRLGVPLRGGLGPRSLTDLCTLFESPLGWPVPRGAAVPGLPGGRVSLAVPDRLRDRRAAGEAGVVLGHIEDGQPVVLPVELRPRHVVVTGAWGTGKSTVAFHAMDDDLRAGRGFVLVDPHGDLAERVLRTARALGRDVVSIDPASEVTDRLSPFDKLAADGSNTAVVEEQIARWLAALVSHLPDEFASVRWFSVAQSMAFIQALHAGTFADVVTWLNDGDTMRSLLDVPGIPGPVRSTLQIVTRSGNDSAEVRAWVSSKFHALVSGPLRNVLDAPGAAGTVADVVGLGVPLIVNLGALSTGEALIMGHLVVESTVAAALARDPRSRQPLHVYLDEAHRFPGVGLRRGLAEGRKFGLSMMLMSQSLTQFDAELADLTLSAGTQVLFRATPQTARQVIGHLGIDPGRLRSLPDLQAVLAVQGQAPLTITVPPYPDPETSPIP